ncbi:polysaccharide biosynthesis tyrosine autokinase [Algoriphagus sp. CAU 1675]|uniref:polysaccharide biosynthesis tyrosine autokinase n=1 Tax=Algoriphagus sp. CAU 1675 TaxID=3032597 RepID=UPI0023DCC0D9|nr:polysaccharide biosynthesis tyrosine autokinase [Algoriphagus sp. CAU 1675]MDF2159367.1 polysaccharide biosynthesis tyrosine autokinase [Algoriphagus sp. CAU 1675]
MIDGKVDISKFEEDVKPINIKYYLIKYARYWPLYVTCVFLGLIVTFLFHRYSVEEYEVQGSILIKQNSSPEMKILDRSNIFSGAYNLENDILLLTSKNLAEEALKKLHFNVTYYASTNIKEVEMYDQSPIFVEVDPNFPTMEMGEITFTMLSEDEFILSKKESGFFDFLNAKADGPVDEAVLNRPFRFGELISSEKSQFKIHKQKHLKVGDRMSFVIHNPMNVIDSYSKAISVRPINSYGTVLQVSMVTKVVEKGRDYVNALMDSYIGYSLKVKNQMTENTLNFLQDQLMVVEDSLKAVERRMLNFKVQNQLMDVNSEFGGVLSNMQDLEEQIQAIDFELTYYQSLQHYLNEKGRDYSEILAPSLVGIADGSLNSLVGSLISLSLERRGLLTSVNENHPKVKEMDAQISRVRENIFENIHNLVENTKERKAQALAKLSDEGKEFSKLPQAESVFMGLNREFKLRENLYNYLLEKRAEAGIARASNISDNSVLDYARRGSLIFPKKSQNYGLAFGLGLIIPLSILLLYHYLNNKIVDQIQLKNVLRIPLLGTIGHSTKDTNLLVQEFPKSMVSESFRSLRSALFYIASDKKCKKILVTSSVSGEGKTFVSINLASAIALSGKKTLIVGLDLRRPKISEYLGVSNQTGLSNYLVDKASREEIIVQTPYENLYVVPSGPIPPNPAELLLKDKMNDFLSSLEEEFDVVVMDTPPIGLVSETMDLLRFSDVNLYIVRQDYTHKRYLMMVNDLYANDQIDNIYAVFNGLKAGMDVYDFGGYNYGYGYNYSYMRKNEYTGAYYDQDNSKSPTSSWLSRLLSKFRV